MQAALAAAYLPWGLLADVVVALHLAYVLFVVLGLVAIPLGAWRGWRWVRDPRFRWTHLAAIVAVALEAVLGILCPLTVWENRLRARAAEGGATEHSFVGRLLHELLFVDASARTLTILYVAFALVVAATLVLVPPRSWSRRRDASPRA